MSKSDAYENASLALLFHGTAIADIAENDNTAPATNLYIAFHTADPGEAGNQQSNEATYTGYARVAVARSAGGFSIVGNAVTLVAEAKAPAATGGSETLTHFSIGRDSVGAGFIFYKGAINPTIAVAIGVEPKLGTGTTITED